MYVCLDDIFITWSWHAFSQCPITMMMMMMMMTGGRDFDRSKSILRKSTICFHVYRMPTYNPFVNVSWPSGCHNAAAELPSMIAISDVTLYISGHTFFLLSRVLSGIFMSLFTIRDEHENSPPISYFPKLYKNNIWKILPYRNCHF